MNNDTTTATATFASKDNNQMDGDTMIRHDIVKAFNDSVQNGIIPMFEILLNNGEYLVVDIEAVDKGIRFSYDTDGKRPCHSGNVVKESEITFLYEYDDIGGLDWHLEEVHSEVLEGFVQVYC